MISTDNEKVQRPWEKWPSTIEVPPHEWRWCFDLRMGVPRVLLQQFEHKRDTEGVSTRRTTVGQPENPHNYPVITFDLVKKMCDTSQAEDTPLRKLFLKNYDRRKLTDEQIELLAGAPDISIAGQKPDEIDAHEKERAAKAAAFLAEVDGKPSKKPQAASA